MSIPSLTERSLIVDGTVIRYFLAGPVGPDTRPLLLIHGTGGSTWSHFHHLFTMLARDQPVISVDLAAPTGSGPKDLTVEHLERQVVAVIEAERPSQQVDLLGYSLGAVVAAAVAGRHPQLIGSLVLVAGWMKTDKHQQLRNRLWFALRNANHEEALSIFMGLSSRSPREIMTVPTETLEAQLASTHFTPFLDQMMDLNRRIDICNAVAAILAPTLIIAAAEDQMVPKHHAKAMFGAIEKALYHEIPSGHALFLERPAEVLHAVQHFLNHPTAYPWGAIIPNELP